MFIDFRTSLHTSFLQQTKYPLYSKINLLAPWITEMTLSYAAMRGKQDNNVPSQEVKALGQWVGIYYSFYRLDSCKPSYCLIASLHIVLFALFSSPKVALVYILFDPLPSPISIQVDENSIQVDILIFSYRIRHCKS